MNAKEAIKELGKCSCSPKMRKPIDLALSALRAQQVRENQPQIVCLCGSARFTDVMLETQWELTKKGCIVLSWCALPEKTARIEDQEGVKEIVDQVHKRKIDLCDRVFVINVDGYIGESTRSEIDYAIAHGKPVGYLEPRVSQHK